MRAALLAIAALSATHASAKVSVDIQAGGGQDSRLISGMEMITSVRDRSVIAVVEDPEPTKKRINLVFMTVNKGEQPYNFGPENIAGRSEEKTFAVITYNQLVKEQERRGFWKRFAGAMAAGSNSVAASNAGNSYGSFSAYGNNGAYAHGTYNSYDSGKAYAAQAAANEQSRQTMEAIERNQSAAIAALGDNLRASTVDPGRMFGGRVVVELPKELRSVKKPTDAILTVDVAGETHIFNVRISPTR